MGEEEFWRIVIGAAVISALPYVRQLWPKSLAKQAKEAARKDRSAKRARDFGRRLGYRWAARK